MRNSKGLRLWFVFGSVLVVAFTTGLTLSYLQNKPRDIPQVEGLLWPDPPSLEPIQLLDHEDEPFTLEQLRGRWSLLFFGFTSCPDICPSTLDSLSRVHENLQTHDLYTRTGQVVFVSVDPERDSSSRLHDYVKYFHKDFIGVTGTDSELRKLTSKLGVLYIKVAESSEHYSVDHSAGIFFIDPALRLVSVVTPPHSMSEIVRRFDAVSAHIASVL
jgi:protein SCO1/2